MSESELYQELGILTKDKSNFKKKLVMYYESADIGEIRDFLKEKCWRKIKFGGKVYGCGRFRNFFAIILPLSKSGLSTLAIYNGVAMWNEFAFANTLLQTPSHKTLPLALGQFKGEHSLNIPINLSVLTLSVLPMIILFIIFQDKLVKGMMAGAVKG